MRCHWARICIPSRRCVFPDPFGPRIYVFFPRQSSQFGQPRKFLMWNVPSILKNGLYYSHCIIPESTIWCAAFFWEVQARRASGRSLSHITISGRGVRDPLPLRSSSLIDEVSTDPKNAKESITLDISRDPHLSAVSFARCEIWSCASDIFYYNDRKII